MRILRIVFGAGIVALIALGALAQDINDRFLQAVEDRDVRAVKRFLSGGADLKAHNSS